MSNTTRACLFDELASWSDMSVRLVINDAMWERIEPLMPADLVRGRRRAATVDSGRRRVEVPPLISVEGAAQRAWLVQDRA